MKNIKNAKKKKSKSFFEGGALFCALFGSLCSIFIFIACLMIFSGVSIALDNAHNALAPFALFSIYSATFLGGFIAVKKNKCRDALLCSSVCGAISTLVLCLAFWIIGLVFDIKSDMLSWLFRALCIAFSILGGFLAINKSKKTKRKRRK